MIFQSVLAAVTWMLEAADASLSRWGGWRLGVSMATLASSAADFLVPMAASSQEGAGREEEL